MMKRPGLVLLLALSMTAAATPATWAAQPPASWDGLVKVKAKRMDLVYLLPGADFRPYSKVMLDPTEAAFRKNWLRDYNSSTMGISRRLSEADAQKAIKAVSEGVGAVFAKAYQAAGYQVVQEPGPDVLRVRTAVINLDVVAPDVMTAGRSRVYSERAGGATLVLEARDSLTGALLGRAIDQKITDDTRPYLRNSVTNRADFERMFQAWAKASIAGLAELKALSPLSEAALTTKR